MLHPVLTHKYVYPGLILFWAFHAVLPAALLHYYADLEWTYALVDGGVYSFGLVIVGLSLWYPVSFRTQEIPITRKLLHNSLICVVAAVIWILVSSFLCRILLGTNQHYIEVASTVLPFRILWGINEFVMFIIASHFFIFYTDLEEKRLQEEVLKKQVKESELKTLKAQLNPHFLFNSLNSVSALTLTSPEDARHMLAQLSELLRYSLSNNQMAMISLSKEMENIRRYMEIERVRFGELLNYEEEIAADCEKSIVPALILLPLYENAIKHGLYESLDPVTVRTKCFRKGNNLFVVVSNNFDASVSSPVGTGLGLKHTANILRNLFGRDGLLVAGASDGIYTVRICIPQS